MSWEQLFSAANLIALVAWAVLILGPRRFWAMNFLVRLAAPLTLSLVYSALILVYFARTNGGFGTLADVRILFASDPVLLAGWVHYLAFDLFVGGWLAGRMDRAAVARVIQSPVLAATFLFGPIGFFLGLALVADRRNFVVSLKELLP